MTNHSLSQDSYFSVVNFYWNLVVFARLKLFLQSSLILLLSIPGAIYLFTSSPNIPVAILLLSSPVLFSIYFSWLGYIQLSKLTFNPLAVQSITFIRPHLKSSKAKYLSSLISDNKTVTFKDVADFVKGESVYVSKLKLGRRHKIPTELAQALKTLVPVQSTLNQ